MKPSPIAMMEEIYTKLSNPFSYIDSAVLRSLKKARAGKNALRIRAILDKHTINKVIITPKLFVEFIEGGRLKQKAYTKEEKEISKRLRNFAQKILSDSLLSNDCLEEEFLFLLNFFCKQFKLILPQEEIFSLAKTEIENYPFIKKYQFIGEGFLHCAKALSNNLKDYEGFIQDLALNATTSFMLDSIHKTAFKKNHLILRARMQQVNTFFISKLVGLRLLESAFMVIVSANNSILRKEIDIAKENLLDYGKDFADSEPPFLFFYGFNGQPVDVYLAEPASKVEKRLQYYSACGVEQMHKYPLLMLCSGLLTNQAHGSSMLIIDPKTQEVTIKHRKNWPLSSHQAYELNLGHGNDNIENQA